MLACLNPPLTLCAGNLTQKLAAIKDRTGFTCPVFCLDRPYLASAGSRAALETVTPLSG
jgi:hypothetical protein